MNVWQALGAGVDFSVTGLTIDAAAAGAAAAAFAVGGAEGLTASSSVIQPWWRS